MGASLRERAAFNENICRFLCAKKRRNYPKTNAAGMLRLRDSGKPPEISFSYIFHSDQCPASAMRRMAFRVFSWEPNAVRRK